MPVRFTLRFAEHLETRGHRLLDNVFIERSWRALKYESVCSAEDGFAAARGTRRGWSSLTGGDRTRGPREMALMADGR